MQLCKDGVVRPLGNRRSRSNGDAISTFWSHVDRRSDDECWEWSAGKTSRLPGQNYGLFSWNHKGIRAHRFSFELHYGPLVGKEMACHTCDNPPCCNPKHLFRGNAKRNSDDMMSKGRHKNGQMVHPEIVKRGQSHPMHKITEAKAMEILRSSASTNDLMQYSLSKSAVNGIRSGRSWAHLKKGDWGRQP